MGARAQTARRAQRARRRRWGSAAPDGVRAGVPDPARHPARGARTCIPCGCTRQWSTSRCRPRTVGRRRAAGACPCRPLFRRLCRPPCGSGYPPCRRPCLPSCGAEPCSRRSCGRSWDGWCTGPRSRRAGAPCTARPRSRRGWSWFRSGACGCGGRARAGRRRARWRRRPSGLRGTCARARPSGAASAPCLRPPPRSRRPARWSRCSRRARGRGRTGSCTR